MSTPGAAWFGIDAFNNPSGDWPRRGGTVPYSALDSEVFVPGLRDLLNPRASVGERMFGSVTLGMTVLPGAGVAIRWVAVAARATGAFRVAGAVARGGTVFWRGVAGGRAASAVLGRTPAQLASKFKHAEAFGVTGKYGKANAAEFSRAIHQHVNGPGVRVIGGTYHKAPVTHYLDPSNGPNVIADPAGNFVSGWRLSPEQLQNVLTHGGL